LKPPLFRLLALWLLLLTSLGHAAANSAGHPGPLTAKEIAQGYRDRVLLAKPHAAARATVDAAEAREGVRVRRKYSRFGDLRVVDLDATDTPSAALARLKATGRYEFVEPDYVRTASVVPNDPRFGTDQWSLNNTGTNGPGADIKAVTAWDTLHDAPNVIVAVIDSGIRATHEDIAANLWTSTTGTHGINATLSTSDPNYGNPNDDHGHGTHVAGIIGAVGNNGAGISGVAWQVQIMSLKFLDSTGTGVVSDEIECFDYAIAHGAQIINGSFGDTTGGSTFSQSELSAITRARDAGLIFVAAAGNDTTNMDVTRQYPASFPLDNIVAVGSSTNRDEVSVFSNYGSGAVELFAPGENILSLGYASNSSYILKSGTSMAAPHVAGALALLKAKFAADSYHQLINRLLRSVDPGAKFAGKCQTGGRLNLAKALASTDNRPFNDDFAARAHLSGANIAARASNLGATGETGEPLHAGVGSGASLWWEWTAPAGGSVTVDTNGSAFDTVLAVYTGTALTGLAPVAANDDSGGSVTSRATFTAQAGVTYEIAVDGKAGATGLVLLNIGTVPANDAFASPVTLTGPSAVVTATNAHCSREAGEPLILGSSGGLSLWYGWTAPRTGQFQIAAFSAQIDPLLAVYTGSSLASLTLVSASDNTGAGGTETASLCTINATAGTTYLITVDSKNAGVPGTFTLSLTDSLWQATTTDSVTGSPAVAPDGSIYVGSTDNSLYAFNADGSVKWSYATGGFIDTCSPAIADDGTIYTGSNDGKVRAFTPASSNPKWTFTVPTPTDTALTTSVSNSPAIAADGTVFIQSADHYLYALNPADGTQRWRFNTNSTSYSSPVIAPDGTVYVGSTDNNLYAINPGGSLKWTFPASNQIYSTVALDAAGNLYFGTLGNTFFSVTSAGAQRWVYTVGGAISSSPALSADGSVVYVGAYDHKLHAVNTATGTVKWTYTLGDEVRASSPAIDANGVIYIGGYDSLLHAVNPDGSLLRTYAMGGWVRSSPVIAGTKLYVGSNDQKLYAFELGVGAATSPWPMYRHNPRRLGRAVFPPTITTQPQSHTVALGSTVVFSVEATGTGLTYQWQNNGSPIPGATSVRLILSNAQAADAGSYTVTVTNSSGVAVTSGTATLAVVATSDPGRIVNLSIRGTSGTGDKVLIMGFVAGGAGTGGTTRLLIRGSGETLVSYGVADAIVDTQIQLIPAGSATPLATNDNWGGTAELKAAATALGAFPFLSDTSRDSAYLGSLARGPCSVIVGGKGDVTGSVIAEIYDANLAALTATTPRLVNISARAYVSAADNLIAGFVIAGATAKTVLIRAIGPDHAYAQYFAPGQVLADPRLDVYRAQNNLNTLVLSNDNWGGDPQITGVGLGVGAFALENAAGRDAILLATLDPGVYSAQAVGIGGAAGIALVEVYDVP
jgi:outer membrane protein assembly factor BamB